MFYESGRLAPVFIVPSILAISFVRSQHCCVMMSPVLTISSNYTASILFHCLLLSIRFQFHFIYYMLIITPLGCLEWIDFQIIFFRFSNYICCQIAFSVFPFQRWLRVDCAVPARRVFFYTTAAMTLLNDLMAKSTIIGTSICCHKRAIYALSKRCTNH